MKWYEKAGIGCAAAIAWALIFTVVVAIFAVAFQWVFNGIGASGLYDMRLTYKQSYLIILLLNLLSVFFRNTVAKD